MPYAHNRRGDRGNKTVFIAIVAFAIVLTGVYLIPNSYNAVSNEAIAEVQSQQTVTQDQDTPQKTQTNSTSTDVELAPVSTRVQEVIAAFTSDHSAEFSIAFKTLDTNQAAGHQESSTIDSASLYKPLAAYRTLQRVESGELSLSGTNGQQSTLAECIDIAITVSDNPCGIHLQVLAQATLTDSLLADWGYAETTLSGYLPQTSARDQVQLFSDIYTAKRISQESSDMLTTHLANQQVTNRLPDYPAGTSVMHKTGDLNGVVNSTTLIANVEEPYVLSILSNDWNDTIQAKYAAISELHAQIHTEVER